jgi:uncharacterized protein (TIGR01244 family)
MSRLAALDEAVSVAGQIGPDDIDPLAAAGFTLIVNNRPDDEEYGQPDGAAIEAAARAAGLHYRHIPFRGMPDRASVEAVANALCGAEGRTLLFCRSGTRSTWVWALAMARDGADVDDLIARAAGAGYDLGSLRLYLG